tara:strand:- start:17512 stop:17823 length:312 start_codon:yes stop_codon:yes gene_type:complete
MTKKVYWPSMRYHPVTGEYLICDTEADVPEGYVASLADVGKKAAPKKKAKAKKKAEPVAEFNALADLELTREAAEDLLNEEEVGFADSETDDEIAAKVTALLE